MYSDLGLMLGGGGTEFIDNGAAKTGEKYAYLVINADAVLATVTDVNAVNVLTDLGLETKTLKQGMIIRARGGADIAAVTVTSGSCFGIISGN